MRGVISELLGYSKKMIKTNLIRLISRTHILYESGLQRENYFRLIKNFPKIGQNANSTCKNSVYKEDFHGSYSKNFSVKSDDFQLLYNFFIVVVAIALITNLLQIIYSISTFNSNCFIQKDKVYWLK